jgi:uncharacterized membrane protein
MNYLTFTAHLFIALALYAGGVYVLLNLDITDDNRDGEEIDRWHP